MNASKEWVILFGGAGRESCIERLIDRGIRVSAVIVPFQRSSKLELAVRNIRALGCNIVEVRKSSLIDTLKLEAGKALLSIGFPYLVPNSCISLFSPSINVHPTLLPAYRGPTTAAFVLINDESESGSTVHFMTDEMDGGNIIAQSHVAISPFDTIRSLQRKVYDSEPQLVLDAIGRLETGFCGVPQDSTKVSEFPKRRRPVDSKIDPSKPLIELINEIRACDADDFPAFFVYHDEIVCIKIWRPNKPEGEDDLI